MPSVTVLKAQNYGEWMPIRRRGQAAGSLGPYSVDELERHGFLVRYSDRVFQAPWTHSLVERGLGWLGRRRPELTGARNALANRRLMRESDVTIGLFEDQGSFAAFARHWHLGPLSPGRMVLAVCWLSQLAQEVEPGRLRGYRRVLAGADLVVFYSQNQRAIFEQVLGVPAARLLFVPFGIDHEFFAAERAADDGYVLAVGGDGSRDHELLVEAVGGTGIPTRIYAPRLDVRPLPPNVTWSREVIDHVAYRDVLARARMVVIPTKATAYPGGQTVLLEAMASSKPVITTSSAAMSDYVEDGVTGLTVRRADAADLRSAIERLLDDSELRDSLGRRARLSVEQRFNQVEMWSRIATGLHGLLGTSPVRST